MKDKSNINDKIKKLIEAVKESNSPIFLKPMDRSLCQRINEYLNSVEDINSNIVQNGVSIVVRQINKAIEGSSDIISSGDLAYEKEDFAAALRFYEKYISTEEKPDIHTCYLAGYCALKIKDYSLAMAYFQLYRKLAYGKSEVYDVRSYIDLCYAMLETPKLKSKLAFYLEESYLEALANQEAVLLKPMDNEEFQITKRFFLKMPHIKMVSINLHGKKTLMIRKCHDDRTRQQELINAAQQASAAENYEDTIKILEEYMSICSLPRSKPILDLARGYEMMGSYQMALIYYEMAHQVGSVELENVSYLGHISRMRKALEKPGGASSLITLGLNKKSSQS